jgi:N-acetylglutamate synthase-like GNAT family acetyltransferase
LYLALLNNDCALKKQNVFNASENSQKIDVIAPGLLSEKSAIECHKTTLQMSIRYSADIKPTPEQIIELYDNSGLTRPTNDRDRIRRMYDNSDLIVSAWDKDTLVGVSRCITDWVWSCYLADLAVRTEYKNSGIGKKLIEITKEQLGEQSMVLLLSVDSALEYYPKVGFTQISNSFIIQRKK